MSLERLVFSFHIPVHYRISQYFIATPPPSRPIHTKTYGPHPPNPQDWRIRNVVGLLSSSYSSTFLFHSLFQILVLALSFHLFALLVSPYSSFLSISSSISSSISDSCSYASFSSDHLVLALLVPLVSPYSYSISFSISNFCSCTFSTSYYTGCSPGFFLFRRSSGGHSRPRLSVHLYA